MCIFTMPQIFQVLRCYKCSVFQVHQTRKDNKWVCKICGEKQSVKRHYGIGTSKDCRTHVQKLNKLRGDQEQTSVNIVDSEDSECEETVDNITPNIDDRKALGRIIKESKWAAYIDEPEQQCENSEPEYINNKEIVLETPQKRKFNRKEQKIKQFRKSIDNNKENSTADTQNHSDNVLDFIESSTSNISDSNVGFSTHINNDCRKTKINSKIATNITSMKPKNEMPSFSLNKVNKDSKWAQYIETDVANESYEIETENSSPKQPLFSLCDDSEIDTILDI
ncbi:MRN complex-interacting protein [Vanessa cardui]|uniref:MRN complex-interacting protein n=1 Tax=Vanessa cardui TaxID=171605 RepID=UPI001F13A104|nr:MRN complex-interacting protein [Vanessa cardui]